MNDIDLKKKIKRLREEIRSLRQENTFLKNKADDYHLLGITAERVSSAKNAKEIIGIVLEYVSSLTNVSYCSYLTLSENQLLIEDEFAANTDLPLKESQFPFDGNMENLLRKEKSYIENQPGKETPLFIPQLNCCSCPNSYYLFPICYKEEQLGWLLFVNCLEDASYLRSHINLLDRIGEIVNTRIEALQCQMEISCLNESLEESIKTKVQANNLLDCIYEMQSKFITFRDKENGFQDTLKESFNDLLDNIIKLTESEYGFIGEILYKDSDTPYIKTWAITDITWDEETQALYRKFGREGMEFHNMDTLFGAAVKTGGDVISNSPSTDPRSGGLPEGHPPLKAFMGLPFYKRNELTGIVGIANRPGGYDEDLALYLKPILSTCARIIDAIRQEKERRLTEDALAKSEQRYELAQEAAKIGSWEWDILTNKLYWSDHIEPMFGFNKKEFKGTYEAFLKAVHPEDLQLVIDAIRSSVEKDREYALEHRIIRPDGTIRSVSERGKVFRNKNGEALRMIGIVQDITEIKNAEKQQQESEQTFSTLVQSISGYLYSITYVKDKALSLYHSPQCEMITGYTPMDYAKDKDLWFKMIHTDDQVAVVDFFEALKRDCKSSSIEHRIIHKTGKLIWVLNKCSITLDEKGHIKRTDGIILDITEKKNAENALIESEKRLCQINDVFLTLDLNHEENINKLTALAGKLLGGYFAIYNRLDKGTLYSAGKWNTPVGYNPVKSSEGQICHTVIEKAEDKIFMVRDLQNSSFAKTDPVIIQNKLRMFIGHAVRCDQEHLGSLCLFYQDDFIPTEEDGKTMGIIATAIGLEEERIKSEQCLKKAKDEAENATKLKDKFVSLVAHDLRAPITVIRGYLQILNENSIDGDTRREIFNETIDSCDDMTQLINDVLNLSKMTSEGIRPEYNFINASKLVEKAISNYMTLARDKGVSLKNEIPENMLLFSDERLMLEAVINIISNAIKFCHKGDKIRVYRPEGEAATIAVKDTGAGIKAERLDNLFRYEAKTSTRGTAGETGTGFGLPLSRDILSAHGGELTVHSIEGEGSTFFLKLPLIRPQILIVDDEQTIIDSIKSYLKTIDADILEALDGESAISAIENGSLHLVLLDIYLPGISGLEVLERLKRDKKTKDIPAIVITGVPDMGIHEKAFQLGADDLVYKPFNKDDFIPRIKRFVG